MRLKSNGLAFSQCYPDWVSDVTDLILADQTEATFGVFGRWGSGNGEDGVPTGLGAGRAGVAISDADDATVGRNAESVSWAQRAETERANLP